MIAKSYNNIQEDYEYRLLGENFLVRIRFMNLYDYCIQNELSDLLKEWNVEKNGALSIRDVTSFSSSIVKTRTRIYGKTDYWKK